MTFKDGPKLCFLQKSCLIDRFVRKARRGHRRILNCPHGYPHLDPMFLMVVNKRDGLVGFINAIHAHAHITIPGRRLQDRDVVDSLPIAVMHLEPLPIRREAGRETQFVYFKSEPQE